MPAERIDTEARGRPQVAGLVLAAGGGRRYGMPKALVSQEGRLLVERAYQLIVECSDPVVVVLGAAADEVRARADLGTAVVVINADWETGMGSSLRAGLAALEGTVDAVLVHLVDLPGMTVAALARVASAAAPDALAVATYNGLRGHPVLLGSHHWAGVAQSAIGDQGARPYLATHDVTEIECSDVADPADLDYPPT